ncbi:MAG TPA: hypothetical protein V6C57_01260 [Coleofasciculaceae cyanobacterium]
MMQVIETQWSVREREIAQAALKTAHNREIAALIKVVREKASQIENINDIWLLNDFLSARRFDIDGKYEDKEDKILFVLARLTADGWLASEDLAGLEPTKLSKIAALSRVL